MTILVTDPELEVRLIAERRETGADRRDEVWDGVYQIFPHPDIDHQGILTGLSTVFMVVLGWKERGEVRIGVGVSDRGHDWAQNYRIPDVAVFLRGTRAQCRDTHWFGGPDFAVEVLSQGDRAREKFDFYARVGTRELLLVDRQRWMLELYRLENGALLPVGVAHADGGQTLASEVLPLAFRLKAGETRPKVEVIHHDGQQRWDL
ncbi:MAG: Uma2 family endonuclease [Isosphaeraceae bacterium]